MKTRGIRQRDGSDCGPACLSFIAAHYGCFLNVSLVRQWARTDRHGTSIYGLIKAAEKVGLNGNALQCRPEGLGELPCPFIAHFVLPTGAGHYVVVTGMYKQTLEVMDPEDGRYRDMTLRDFLGRWSGFAVILDPNENFVTQNKTSNLSRILHIIKPHRIALSMALIASLVFTVIAVSMTAYIQQVVDKVIDQHNMAILAELSIVMIICLVIQSIAGVIKGRVVLNISQSVDRSLVMGYYSHVLRLPRTFHDNMRTGEIMSRINDALRINVFINEVLIAFIIDGMTIVFSVVLMSIYNWKMGCMMLLILPVYLLLYLYSDRINKKWQQRIMLDGAKVDALISETLHSAGVIKQFAVERYVIQKVNYLFENLLRSIFINTRKQLNVYSSTDFFTRIFTVFIVWIGCHLIFGGELSKGELLSFFAMMSYFTAPAISLMSAGKSIRDAMLATDRLFEITDLEQEHTKPAGIISAALPGDIEFRNVSFRYGNGGLVLENFSLLISKNMITGIKGHSGAGKTTILSLLLRLYEVEKGEILINGIDISQIGTSALRSLISVVPQQTELLSCSIIENICLDDGEPDMDRLMEIAKRTGVYELAESLPQGMNTIIVEQGANLSGGQKQKISLARALYRNAPTLILDEPTASLDADSEEKIMQTIDWYKKKGNTVIIISHSDTALKICDNIVILKN